MRLYITMCSVLCCVQDFSKEGGDRTFPPSTPPPDYDEGMDARSDELMQQQSEKEVSKIWLTDFSGSFLLFVYTVNKNKFAYDKT